MHPKLTWWSRPAVAALALFVGSCRSFGSAADTPDASTPSGPGASDASPGGLVPDASAPRTCGGNDATHQCTDFDGADPFAGFVKQPSDGTGLALTSGHSSAKAASFTVRPGGGAAVNLTGSLDAVDGARVKHFELAFWGRIDELPKLTEGSYFVFASLFYKEPTCNLLRKFEVYLSGEGTLALSEKAYQPECSDVGRETSTGKAATDFLGWHRYQIVVDASGCQGGAPSVALLVDSRRLACRPLSTTPFTKLDALVYVFGIVAAGPRVDEEAQIALDDVSLTVE